MKKFVKSCINLTFSVNSQHQTRDLFFSLDQLELRFYLVNIQHHANFQAKLNWNAYRMRCTVKTIPSAFLDLVVSWNWKLATLLITSFLSDFFLTCVYFFTLKTADKIFEIMLCIWMKQYWSLSLSSYYVWCFTVFKDRTTLVQKLYELLRPCFCLSHLHVYVVREETFLFS